MSLLSAEMAGKYSAVQSIDYVPPPGFEAHALVRTEQGFSLPVDSSTVLKAWQSTRGNITRFIAGRSDDAIVLGYYEWDSSEANGRYQYLLQLVRIGQAAAP